MTKITFHTTTQATRLLNRLRDAISAADLAVHRLAACVNEKLPQTEGEELEVSSELSQEVYDLINEVHDRLVDASAAEGVAHALANSVFVNAGGVYLPFGGGVAVAGLHSGSVDGAVIQLKSGGTNKDNDPPKVP